MVATDKGSAIVQHLMGLAQLCKVGALHSELCSAWMIMYIGKVTTILYIAHFHSESW